MKTLVLSSLVLAALASGCMVDRNYLDPNQNVGFGVDRGGGEIVSDPNIQNAQLSGDIGPVRQFDGPASAYLSDEQGYSNLTVDSRGSNGSGFIMLYLDKSIRDLPAGETHMRGNNNMEDTNYVQLCSDSDSGDHFDGIASDVIIVVTERGDVRDIDVDATISEGFEGSNYDTGNPTVVTSHFTLLN
ncbi:MAG: hypothetical protein Q8O67_27135 [Deltaproteobacteria bacterium]|nr:hypothetical protein [Deltaproteobacteria bacterium]